MLIKKDRLPKGLSFVLRSSVMEEAFRSAGITTDASLHHLCSGIFFDAYFWPPNPNVAYERFYIRAGVAPSSQAREARDFAERIVIPRFVAWAGHLLSLPLNSPTRRDPQHFSLAASGLTPHPSFHPNPLRGPA